MLVAAHHHLDNLIMIVDQNGFQAMGTTDEVLELGSLQDKFTSFGFEATTIDGHDEAKINATINSLLASNTNRPKAIIAKTIKGKGVAFMESNNIWHYTRLTQKSYNDAVSSLGALGGSK
jgi:transketolase